VSRLATLLTLPLALLVFLSPGPAAAQVGPLIWEESFDNLDSWIIETGNGSWGWGNGELEYYSPNNVEIVPIPGEPGSNALRITARQESGPGITDQWGNPLQYTSGKLNTKSHVSVQYGMIETRLRVPDLDQGGWPAFWMLGMSNIGWPRKGELDIMEMGGKQVFRDLHDTHNGGNGLDNATVNESVHSNAIFYSDAAVVPGNESGAASISWDPEDAYCRPYYNHANPLNDRFLIYRLYWDENSLRFTVVDQGVEYDLFEDPFPIDEESEEFRNPFYFITNLAIGGAYTDCYVLGDPGSGDPVTMNFPAEMYVDYIRVYEWNGQGQVHLGPPEAKFGTFGLYTEETPVNDEHLPEVDEHIYVWEGTLTDGSIPPFEGENCLSWQTTGLGWFGAGIMALQPLNLFDFGDGHIKFRIKIPAHVTFKIGIIDSWGNQNYVSFPAHQTIYGLVRNGEWGQAAIPVADIRGEYMDLRMLSYSFVILEEHGAACEFALDDIYWETEFTAGVDDNAPVAVKRIELGPNVPNPFNPRTTISFELDSPRAVTLRVYDMAGHLVRTLVSGRTYESGNHQVMWDGLDNNDEAVASGVYLYRLEAGGEQDVRRMVLVR
jgi:beta-glucanase (GH16 family)